MTVRVWQVAAALVVSATFLGCAEERDGATPPPPQAPRVEITALSPSAIANGTNTVGLSVIETGGAPVTVSTNLGTFDPTGFTTAYLSTGSGTVTLRTCSGCSGTATVTATSRNDTAAASVQFVTLASACLTNCSVDPGCGAGSLACNLAGGGTGTCSATTCVAPPACVPSGASETSCGNGTDEDCNGDTDCGDAACDGQACPGGATFFCRTGRCTDVATGFAVTVTPARARLPANGSTTTTVEVEVTADASPIGSIAVSVATTLGTITPPSGVTGTDGKVRFTFGQTAPTAGVATITATLVAVPTVTGTATITLPKLGALQVVAQSPGSVQYPVMGVKDSGWREYGWIQVQAIDDTGLPYPDDLAVDFAHESLGGSTFAAPATVAGCTAPACVGSRGVVASPAADPDTTGLAQAWVYPGTLAGTLAFTATASAGGVTRTILLPTVAVVGAKASGSNFSVVCSPRNLPALAETDCSISLVDEPFTCEALLKDRFGNVLGRQTQVFFKAEASSVGQVVWTPEYTGAAGPQLTLGIAEQGFSTLGSGLPFDVDPIAGEPGVDHDLDGCGLATHNPRDGVVTIVAIADGEEAFFDANGNGTRDGSEPFVDLGEPFVDQDDDGQWDAGEWFLDVDYDAAYTPANGVWDAQAKIWTQTVVVYTGPAETLDSGGLDLGQRIADAGVSACTSTAAPASFDLDLATTVLPAEERRYWLYASDMNLNFLHAGATYDVSSRGAGSVDLLYWGFGSYTDELGMLYRYRPCSGGTCAPQCQATGGTICTMEPSLTGFSCGLRTAVDLTASGEGGVAVDWAVEVPWQRYGTGAYRRTVRTVGGVVRTPP